MRRRCCRLGAGRDAALFREGLIYACVTWGSWNLFRSRSRSGVWNMAADWASGFYRAGRHGLALSYAFQEVSGVNPGPQARRFGRENISRRPSGLGQAGLRDSNGTAQHRLPPLQKTQGWGTLCGDGADRHRQSWATRPEVRTGALLGWRSAFGAAIHTLIK
jgi:hypothetical protein